MDNIEVNQNKYQAVWPFISICVQVLILSIVILVYEKYKNDKEIAEHKQDLDKSSDQDLKDVSDLNRDNNSSFNYRKFIPLGSLSSVGVRFTEDEPAHSTIKFVTQAIESLVETVTEDDEKIKKEKK